MTAIHHSGRHRQTRRRDHFGRRLATVSMMGVAGVAGWLVTAKIAEPQTPPEPVEAAASAPMPERSVPEQIQQAGQVIAASNDSLTTTTPDGKTTTFRITPQTAQIAPPGTVNVVVVGVVQNGVPVATAIADQGAVGPNGPPMDYGLPT